jgi:DNA polymerase III epsilon subunit-like protein
MARRSKKITKTEFNFIVFLVAIALPVCAIFKLGESIGWGVIFFGALFCFILFLFSNRKKNEFINFNQRHLNLPPTRNNAKPNIDKFLNVKRSTTNTIGDIQNQVNLPPTRNNAKPDIDKFLNVKRKTRIIVFDVETNGLYEDCSVLSCSAIKFEIDPKTYEAKELERFDRFYFPVERFNPEATDINGLTREIISEKRISVHYPKHFIYDTDFKQFCEGVVRFVAHNILFDMRFISFLKAKKKFCTMKTNTDIVAAEFLKWKNEWKYPKLSETASFYEIAFNEIDLHSSLADTELTAKIFFKMCNAIK